MNLRRLLATPLLATGLLLSTLGCSKKKEPTPEPTLEGTWDEVSFVSTPYVNGQPRTPQINTQPGRNDPNGRYQIYTGATIQGYYNYGAVTGPIQSYTRSGNTLSISSSSAPTVIQNATITQLTATDLTLQFKIAAMQPSQYDYFIVDASSKRR